MFDRLFADVLPIVPRTVFKLLETAQDDSGRRFGVPDCCGTLTSRA
jgi:hypothetical protein